MYLRRVRRLFVLFALPVLVLAGRLYHLQVVNGRASVEAQVEAPVVRGFIDEQRGRILDRHGRVLAQDEILYDVCVDYLWIHPDGERLKRELRRRTPAGKGANKAVAEEVRADFLRDVDRYWRRLADLTGRPLAELHEAREAVRKRIERRRESVNRSRGAEFELAEEQQEHPVLRGVDTKAVMAIESAEPRVAGLTVKTARSRWYPFGDRAPHIIGYLGSAGSKENDNKLSAENLDGYAGTDRVGRAGVEQSFEERLHPRRGYYVRPVGKRDAEPKQFVEAQPGEDVRLTIDMDLQTKLEDQLDTKGALVVLDVATGEVLAMATWPRFDLNSVREKFAEMAEDQERRPLVNRAISHYAPGSTVKPVVGVAALASGRAVETTCYHCSGKWPGGGGFACWIARSNGGGAHGSIPLHTALRHSCNHYFFYAAQAMGGDTMSDWMKRFGLGRPTGVGLPGEGSGLIPDDDWFRKQRGRNGQGWQHADERLVSIGQGPTLATPLQMASVAATLARGGVWIRPHVVIDDSAEPEDLGASRSWVRAVTRGMCEVAGPGGPAHEHVAVRGIPIAGKTGTAQVWALREGKYQPADPHCWFIGFAPADAPKVAFAVLLENVPKGGGAVSAGPYAKRVVEAVRDAGYIDGTSRSGGSVAAPRRPR